MTADPDTPEARLRAFCDAWPKTASDLAAGIHVRSGDGVPSVIPLTISDIRAVLDRLARAEEALRFYSCHDGCNDCTENERDLIGCGWTARAALRGNLAAYDGGADA